MLVCFQKVTSKTLRITSKIHNEIKNSKYCQIFNKTACGPSCIKNIVILRLILNHLRSVVNLNRFHHLKHSFENANAIFINGWMMVIYIFI